MASSSVSLKAFWQLDKVIYTKNIFHDAKLLSKNIEIVPKIMVVKRGITMSVFKKKSILFYIVIHCITIQSNVLRAMEKKIEKSYNKSKLLQAVNERDIDTIANILSSTKLHFKLLARVYTYALSQAKKLTPNADIRRDPCRQEAIKKMQFARESALKKTRREQIDETLVDQGKLYAICAQTIYPHLEPLITKANNANSLFYCIGCTGHLGLLQDFIETYETHINWNFCDDSGITLLHIAAKEDNVDMIDYLLTKNIPINSQTYYDENTDSSHKTPLHYAAENHRTTIVKRLLDKKSDPNITDYFGELPLHYVAPGKYGNREIFEMLLAAGTNIDSTNDNGKTLLYKAVEENNIEAVEYLLALGASPTNQSRKYYLHHDTDVLANYFALLLQNSASDFSQFFASEFTQTETPLKLAKKNILKSIRTKNKQHTNDRIYIFNLLKKYSQYDYIGNDSYDDSQDIL